MNIPSVPSVSLSVLADVLRSDGEQRASILERIASATTRVSPGIGVV